MSTAFEDFLGGGYSERVLKRVRPGTTVADFRRAVQADAALKKEAARHLAGLTDEVCKRCFVSQAQRRLLSEVLSP